MKSRTLFALHGFLGLGSDWSFLSHSTLKDTHHIVAPSYLSSSSPFPPTSLRTWCDKIASWATQHSSGNRIFLGYSLGARLGLYLAAYHEDVFEKFILVAPHLGNLSTPEREERVRNDAHWASRFLNKDWDFLISDWNAQEIFQYSHALPKRMEHDFSRTYLVDALNKASTGLSEDFSSHSILQSEKVQFVVGEDDKKYLNHLQNASVKHLIVVDNAGHRVPWDAPTKFLAKAF